jgi:transposase
MAINSWSGFSRPGSPPGVCELLALEALRRIWLQQYYRCAVPGLETLRWRTADEQPPAALRIASPYDPEACYSSKRNTYWWAISATPPRL